VVVACLGQLDFAQVSAGQDTRFTNKPARQHRPTRLRRGALSRCAALWPVRRDTLTCRLVSQWTNSPTFRTSGLPAAPADDPDDLDRLLCCARPRCSSRSASARRARGTRRGTGQLYAQAGRQAVHLFGAARSAEDVALITRERFTVGVSSSPRCSMPSAKCGPRRSAGPGPNDRGHHSRGGLQGAGRWLA